MPLDAAMENEDAGRNCDNTDDASIDDARGGMSEVDHKPAEKADIRNHHHAKPDSQISDLLLNDIQLRQQSLRISSTMEFT